jgi:vesicle coat complex subunit
MRQSISAVDDLIKSSANGTGSLELQAANLILLLQGKVYKDYACNSVTASVSRSQLVALRHAVQARVLELTINLEKSIPTATDIALGNSPTAVQVSSDRVTQITNQVIYGNVTSITSSGAAATFNLAVRQGDEASFIEALVKAGIADDDARALGQIVASETPESKEDPFGSKAKTWIVDNLKKAMSGAWKIGVSVATDLLKEAALKYYGLK